VTPTTITLSRPIERRNGKGEVVDSVATLTPREPELGDVLDALGEGMASDGKVDIGGVIGALGARLCGISVAELRRLSLRDGVAVAKAVQGFLPPGLIDGLTGSRSLPGISASLPGIAGGAAPSSVSGPPAPPSGNGG
jgi:hypothetical protein